MKNKCEKVFFYNNVVYIVLSYFDNNNFVYNIILIKLMIFYNDTDVVTVFYTNIQDNNVVDIIFIEYFIEYYRIL